MSTQDNVSAMVKFLGAGLDSLHGKELTQEQFFAEVKRKDVPSSVHMMLFLFFASGGFVASETYWRPTNKKPDFQGILKGSSSENGELVADFMSNGMQVFTGGPDATLTEKQFIERFESQFRVPADVGHLVFGFLHVQGLIASETYYKLTAKGERAYEEGQARKRLVDTIVNKRGTAGGISPSMQSFPPTPVILTRPQGPLPGSAPIVYGGLPGLSPDLRFKAK